MDKNKVEQANQIPGGLLGLGWGRRTGEIRDLEKPRPVGSAPEDSIHEDQTKEYHNYNQDNKGEENKQLKDWELANQRK